jgi:hypothetical protein
MSGYFGLCWYEVLGMHMGVEWCGWCRYQETFFVAIWFQRDGAVKFGDGLERWNILLPEEWGGGSHSRGFWGGMDWLNIDGLDFSRRPRAMRVIKAFSPIKLYIIVTVLSIIILGAYDI